MIYEAIDRWNDPNTYLEHHGVKGMKWGVRKAYHNFQGRRLRRSANKIQEDINSLKNARNKNGMSEKDTNKSVAALEKIRDKQLNKAEQHENYQPKSLTKGQKIAIGVGVGAAVAVGAGVGVYMLKKHGMKPVAPLDRLKYATPKTIEPKAMKTPISKLNVRKGPSTLITGGGPGSNEFSLGLKNQSKLQANFDYVRERKNIVNNPNTKRKVHTAFNNLDKAKDLNTWQYHSAAFNPLMTTKSGAKISDAKFLTKKARLNRISNIKSLSSWPRVTRTKSYLG